MTTPSVPPIALAGEPVAGTLTVHDVQKKAIEYGFVYWRAPDAHGVSGTKPQAIELLQDLLRVEVEIEDNGCSTCDGTGIIGGPSYYAPDEGGEPCPGCTAPTQGADDAQPDEEIIAALHRIKEFVSETKWPRWDKGRQTEISRGRILEIVDAALAARDAVPIDAQDADRYKKCREQAVRRGLFEKPEEYDAMVDESIERMEVAFRKGHNYGKKRLPNGSLAFPASAQRGKS